MPAQSLCSLAIEKAKRNWQNVEDIGDSPYDLVKPILAAIRDPEQLRRIEINCPHIADSDAELWRAFIVRDIPDWSKKLIEPSNPRSWWKVYRKLLREHEILVRESEEKLKATLIGIKTEREANKVQTTTELLRIPRDPLGPGQHYVTTTARTSSKAMFNETNANKRKGQTIMQKVRKEGATSAAAKNIWTATHKQNQSLHLKHVTRIQKPMIKTSAMKPAAMMAPAKAAAIQGAAKSFYGIVPPKVKRTVITAAPIGAIRPRLTAFCDKTLDPKSVAEQAKVGVMSSLGTTSRQSGRSKDTTSEARTAQTINSASANVAGVPDSSLNTPIEPNNAAAVAALSMPANKPLPIIKKRPAPSIFVQRKKRTL